MHNYYLNIGSNIGNRRLNISRALAAIEEIAGYFETSRAIESESWGYESENKFLNIGVSIKSELSPEEMLRKLKEAERKICSDSHRTKDGAYADRVIDIDIMAADDLIVDTEELQIPHRHLADRRFFIVPMMELAPGWKDPRTGEPLIEMYRRLDDMKESKSRYTSYYQLQKK